MPFALKLMEQDGLGGFVERARLDGVTTAAPVWTAPVSEVLNSIGATSFALSLDDSRHAPFVSALAVNWLRREVWVYDMPAPVYPFLESGSAPADPLVGLVPIWQGLPMRPTKAMGEKSITVQCAELPWIFTRRHFGKTDRTNYLDPNAGFHEGTFNGWTTSTAPGTTTNIVTTHAKTGDYSAELTSTDPIDFSVQRTFTVTVGGIGALWAIAAWYYIEPGATVESYEDRLLFAEMRQGGVVIGTATVELSATQQVHGTWVRAEIPVAKTLRAPPNATVDINVRGYGVKGTIRWGAFLAVVMESFSSAQPGGSDLATLAAGMINHAQDPAFGKDSLDIDLNTPATGKLMAAAWQHADHGNIWTVGINDLVGREDGIDVWMSYQADGRTFNTASRVGAALGRGVDRTALDLSLGAGNVLRYGFTKDGQQAANGITILGDGDGPDREEGGYIDLTSFGGRAFEMVLQAPQGADINSLDQRAWRAGLVHARPTILNLALAEGVVMEPGDRVTVPAYDPFIDPGTYRVMDVARNPANGARTIGVNPA